MASSVKVKSGDTLSQIAKSKGVTLQALLAANPGIKNANMIRVGQTIKMPKANSVPGNTKGSPYGRMSQTQMNMLKGSKGQQEAVTSALRREVKDSGAQTTPTPKKAKKILNAPYDAMRERAMKRKPAPKKAPPKKNNQSMSGLRDDDVAAKKGGYMKKYQSGGKTSSEANRLAKLARVKKPRRPQQNSMANDVTTGLGRTRAEMEAVARGGVKAKNKGGIMRGAGAATRGKKFGRCG